MTLEQALLGILSALITLIGGYLVHSYKEASAMRTEYRERCKTLEAKLDAYQLKYLVMAEENGKLKNRVRAMQAQLDDLKEKFLPEDSRRIYENG